MKFTRLALVAVCIIASMSLAFGTNPKLRDCDPPDQNCPKGPVGPVFVRFHVDTVDVLSPCKEISNVVLLFCDGTHYKIDNLSGHSGRFSGVGDYAGAPIAGVWVKAGRNHSGDGPGYGQFFESPLECPGGEPPDDPAPEPDG